MNTGSMSRWWSSNSLSAGVMVERPTIRHSFLTVGDGPGDAGMPASCDAACGVLAEGTGMPEPCAGWAGEEAGWVGKSVREGRRAGAGSAVVAPSCVVCV